MDGGNSIIGSIVGKIIGDTDSDPVPANALLDQDGNPILDQDGNYILTGP